MYSWLGGVKTDTVNGGDFIGEVYIGCGEGTGG